MKRLARQIYLFFALTAVTWGTTEAQSGKVSRPDPKDWSMYNHDVVGSRNNPGETAISRDNASKLQKKWQFPAEGSDDKVGVIHATPVVVNGYVYFGTATHPSFYKLAPDGKIRWSYGNPDSESRIDRAEPSAGDDAQQIVRLRKLAGGIFCSALVTEDSVFFADMGGWIYALDRETGQEKWKLNSRAKEFPGAHPINLFFASPIVADGTLIIAGGTLEQLAAANPAYRGCTGRRFVMALTPTAGHILWNYDVGPNPQPLDPPITITDKWGDHIFYFGPATSSVWCTPSFDAESGTIFFGT